MSIQSNMFASDFNEDAREDFETMTPVRTTSVEPEHPKPVTPPPAPVSPVATSDHKPEPETHPTTSPPVTRPPVTAGETLTGTSGNDLLPGGAGGDVLR